VTQPPRIVRGLPPGLEERAAALYWQAFGAKLAKLLGPRQRGERFFQDAVNHNAILAALGPDDTLLGLAAFQNGAAGFSAASAADLWRHYGIGALWRILPLALLERTSTSDTLQMDGICVAPEARGLGVGTLLLEAIFHEARSLGKTRVTLDVIDTNPRARALYERRGFVSAGSHSTSILRPLLGFSSAKRMIRDV